MEGMTGVMVDFFGSFNDLEFNTPATISTENMTVKSIEPTTSKVSTPLAAEEESKENISYLFIPPCLYS